MIFWKRQQERMNKMANDGKSRDVELDELVKKKMEISMRLGESIRVGMANLLEKRKMNIVESEKLESNKGLDKPIKPMP